MFHFQNQDFGYPSVPSLATIYNVPIPKWTFNSEWKSKLPEANIKLATCTYVHSQNSIHNIRASFFNLSPNQNQKKSCPATFYLSFKRRPVKMAMLFSVKLWLFCLQICLLCLLTESLFFGGLLPNNKSNNKSNIRKTVYITTKPVKSSSVTYYRRRRPSITNNYQSQSKTITSSKQLFRRHRRHVSF